MSVGAGPKTAAADMLSAALGYAAKGWKVFPVQPDGKAPLTTAGYKDGTDNPDQIRAWWFDTPKANIGLALEQSGLVAIDADTYKPECDWAKTATANDVPTTLIQCSARGGTHYIFKADDCARYVGRVGEAVDVKHRGYILLEPSTFEGGIYRFQNDAPIAQAPDWLKRPERTLAEVKGNAQGATGRTLAEVEDALRYVSADCNYHTWLSVLQGLHSEFGSDAIQLAEEWSLTAPHRFEDGAVDRKFASFSGDGGVTINTVFDLARKGGADLGALAHRHFDVTEFFAPVAQEVSSIFEQLAANSKQAPDGNAKRRGLPLMSFAEAAASALEAGAEPLIDGLLDAGAASVVFGPSNVGKTFVVLDMAHAVATGRPWAGRATTRSGVLYLALEGGGGIRKRFAALQLDHPGAVPSNLVLSCATIDMCGSPDSAQDIIDAVGTIPGGCGLVVVDTMARAMNGGDENSAVDVGKFVSNIDAIRRATGAHVLVVHHTGKEVGRGARGHSSLRAAVDTEIEIAAGAIKNPKQRDHDLAEDMAFALEGVALGNDAKGRPVKSAVVRIRADRDQATPSQTPTATEARMLDAVRAMTTGRAAAASDASADDVAAYLKGQGEDIEKGTARKHLDRLCAKQWLRKPKSGTGRGRYSLTAVAQLEPAALPPASFSTGETGHFPSSTSSSTSLGGTVVSLPKRRATEDRGRESGRDIFG